MKLKLDENMPGMLWVSIQDTMDVHTVADEGLEGCSDLDLAEACEGEGRVLMTLDRGFGDLLRHPLEADSPGRVVLRVAQQDAESVTRCALKAISLFDSLGPPVGRVWIVEDASDRVRIRAA